MKRAIISMTSIFEELYYALYRESLFDLKIIMERVEKLHAPRGAENRAQYDLLLVSLDNALTTCEARLASLRTRYEALPKISEKKEED